jgi:hypothetical protein
VIPPISAEPEGPDINKVSHIQQDGGTTTLAAWGKALAQ